MERVILVNEHDQLLGVEEKMIAHQKGLRHRAFSVFVYRLNLVESSVEFLLQQRHPEKYHSGGLWTNTCCSHPRPDEDIVEAAERRLKEELSLTVSLTQVNSFEYRAEFENGLIEHEIDHVLVGEYLGEFQGDPGAFDPKEIQQIQWLTVDHIREKLVESPTLFTPWFKQAFDIALQDLSCRTY